MNEVLVVGGVAVAGDITAIAVALITTQRQAKADAERLHIEHLEADRRVRRDAYIRLMNAASTLEAMTTRYVEETTETMFEAWLRDFRSAEVEVALVESQAVRDAREALQTVYARVDSEVKAGLESAIPLADALVAAYESERNKIEGIVVRMVDAMRNDLAFTRPRRGVPLPPAVGL